MLSEYMRLETITEGWDGGEGGERESHWVVTKGYFCLDCQLYSKYFKKYLYGKQNNTLMKCLHGIIEVQVPLDFGSSCANPSIKIMNY